MYVLTALMPRNGAFCREYYQPEVTGRIPGVVFGGLSIQELRETKRRAKQYPTREEALADIPNWIALHRKYFEDKDCEFDPCVFDADMRKLIAVDTV